MPGDSADARSHQETAPQSGRSARGGIRAALLIVASAAIAAAIAGFFAARLVLTLGIGDQTSVLPPPGSPPAAEQDALAKMAAAAAPASHDPAADADSAGTSGQGAVGILRREAFAAANDIVTLYPANPLSYAVLARCYSAFGNSTEAMANWRQALRIEPRFLQAYLGMVWLAMERADYPEAEKLAREVLTLNPQLTDAHKLLADALLEQRRPREAIEILTHDLQLEPRSVPAHYMMGKAYLQLEDYAKAKDHYEQAVRYNPGYVHAHYGLGTVYAKLGDKAKSAESLRTFKELRDKISAVQLERLQVHDETAVRRNVSDVYALAGEVYLGQGKPSRAEAIWKKGVEVDAEDVECRKGLVSLHEQQGKLPAAIELLQQLTQIERYNADHWLRLGTLHGGLKHFDEAEQAFTQVCEIVPDSSVGFATLAKLFIDAGRKADRAVELARKAVELEPVARNYFVLGEACQANNDQAGAQTAAQRAVELDPGSSVYRTLLQSVQRKE
jgi:tetratricopeptide (TPR) repeat protein